MGKRTKYQIDAKAQFFVDVYGKDTTLLNKEKDKKDVKEWLPTSCLLDDENMLESILWDDKEKVNFTKLMPIHQCVLLGLADCSTKLNHLHHVSEDVQFTYLERLLMQPQVWCIQFSGLLIRSLSEVT
eukprot:UN09553